MKKKPTEPDGMRSEYTLMGGMKNPYAKRAGKGINLVLIEPDLFQAFPSSEAVNRALRTVLNAAVKATDPRAQPAERTAKAS